ncbi:ribosomal protein S18-alanine N-acetyltransferase [Porticoccus sp.]|uniref:ribosomal protein S18-alanine N-acetyltransferase n=1 Tax=Porticoccus sp. TaxID=2024853 RepID=UPI003F697444
MTPVIRKMLTVDLPLISAIEQQVTPHPWRESQFRESLDKHQCLTMTLQDQPVGYAVYTIVLGEAEILNIAVGRGFQGRGYGRQLLNHMIGLMAAQAERLFLEVRATNAPALALYQDVGLVEICLRRNYYQNDSGQEDAIVMAMDFAGFL